jgi:DNA-binding GntR family transcriptional regulator
VPETPVPQPGQPPLAYERIAEQLKQHIRMHALPPGAALPSQSHLMRQHRASSLTVQKAIGLLRQEGWALSRPGKGAFVAPRQGAEAAGDRARTETPPHTLAAALEQIAELRDRVRRLESTLSETRGRSARSD